MIVYPRYPVDYVGITQYFSTSHRALDLGWHTPNPPIYSAADGVVVSAGVEAATRGIFAVVRHDNVIQNKIIYTLYWHLKELSVETGQSVRMGSQIGIMGQTGIATGVHLHFGFWICPTTYTVWNLSDQSRYAVDPLKYVYLYPTQQQAASNRGVLLLSDVSGETGGDTDGGADGGDSGSGTEDPDPKPLTAGQELTLSRAPLYASSTASRAAGTVTGTYYTWDATIVSGRIRITNMRSRVGVSGQVTGWIDEEYVSGAEVVRYTVRSGDTLSALARTYGTTVKHIMELNPQIKNANLIYTGQTIYLPS